MILTRAQALKVSGRTFKNLAVAELDGELRLASLSAGPALALSYLKERAAKGEDVNRAMMVLVIESAIVDESGLPLFDTAAAGEFLDRISPDTLLAINTNIPAAASPKVDPGNSKASTVAG